MRRILFSAFLFVCSLSPLFADDEAKPEKVLSIIRVNVTNQPWDFARPWGKRPPYSRRAIGTVLQGNRVLVTAELVANATYVEFETPEGGRKVPASVDVVDYEANLALLVRSQRGPTRKVCAGALTSRKIRRRLVRSAAARAQLCRHVAGDQRPSSHAPAPHA